MPHGKNIKRKCDERHVTDCDVKQICCLPTPTALLHMMLKSLLPRSFANTYFLRQQQQHLEYVTLRTKYVSQNQISGSGHQLNNVTRLTITTDM